MRFELSVALKYLLPRARQLSVSIISLISVLVISLVVWLVIVFLSVTHGIEKKWLEELVTINAPLRMTPTEEYYKSYYYLSDTLSERSGYSSKSLGEKLHSPLTDSYDPSFDAEIPLHFPIADKNPDGSVKDLVKEGWEAISSLNSFKGMRAHEFEVTFGNLELDLFRSEKGEIAKSFLTQLCYISSFDTQNKRLGNMILPPAAPDVNNLLFRLSTIDTPQAGVAQSTLFTSLENIALKPLHEGTPLPTALYPNEGVFKAYGLMQGGKISKILLPSKKEHRNKNKALEMVEGSITFKNRIPEFAFAAEMHPQPRIVLDPSTFFSAQPLSSTFPSLLCQVETVVQGIKLAGTLPLKNLEIAEASLPSSPLIFSKGATPEKNPLGIGILIARNFQKSGVLLGDAGTISYYQPTTGQMKEQRIPIYVAGFYDPGLMPTGNKVVFADTSLLASMRSDLRANDNMLGNGFQIYLSNINDAPAAKEALILALNERGLSKYFTVESFADYEFAKPVLEQLKSDKTLFTLIAVIILIVACSNIISMLILLVNDKKKEIGILQSMGLSTRQIASIFGLCGFLTGVISSVIGILSACVTLHYLQSLVNLLSFMQGREAFQAAFYGSSGLPNELSYSALIFVLISTICISLLAGIVPAIKASRIRPAVILRSE